MDQLRSRFPASVRPFMDDDRFCFMLHETADGRDGFAVKLRCQRCRSGEAHSHTADSAELVDIGKTHEAYSRVAALLSQAIEGNATEEGEQTLASLHSGISCSPGPAMAEQRSDPFNPCASSNKGDDASDTRSEGTTLESARACGIQMWSSPHDRKFLQSIVWPRASAIANRHGETPEEHHARRQTFIECQHDRNKVTGVFQPDFRYWSDDHGDFPGPTTKLSTQDHLNTNLFNIEDEILQAQRNCFEKLTDRVEKVYNQINGSMGNFSSRRLIDEADEQSSQTSDTEITKVDSPSIPETKGTMQTEQSGDISSPLPNNASVAVAVKDEAVGVSAEQAERAARKKRAAELKKTTSEQIAALLADINRLKLEREAKAKAKAAQKTDDKYDFEGDLDDLPYPSDERLDQLMEFLPTEVAEAHYWMEFFNVEIHFGDGRKLVGLTKPVQRYLQPGWQIEDEEEFKKFKTDALKDRNSPLHKYKVLYDNLRGQAVGSILNNIKAAKIMKQYEGGPQILVQAASEKGDDITYLLEFEEGIDVEAASKKKMKNVARPVVFWLKSLDDARKNRLAWKAQGKTVEEAMAYTNEVCNKEFFE